MGRRDAEALHGRAHSSHTVACANLKMMAFDPEEIELKRHELINLIHARGMHDRTPPGGVDMSHALNTSA